MIKKFVLWIAEKMYGHVVVTTTLDGECVFVTRQDDEGRILSVIWQKTP